MEENNDKIKINKDEKENIENKEDINQIQEKNISVIIKKDEIKEENNISENIRRNSRK